MKKTVIGSVAVLAAVIAALGLISCANLKPDPVEDLPTKDDIQAAQTMREMNGFHSGRIEE